jgi:hypothetical protein
MLFSCEETNSFQRRQSNTQTARVFENALPKTKRLHGVLGCAAFARAWRHRIAIFYDRKFKLPSVVSKFKTSLAGRQARRGRISHCLAQRKLLLQNPRPPKWIRGKKHKLN